jgi:hypothetical protein
VQGFQRRRQWSRGSVAIAAAALIIGLSGCALTGGEGKQAGEAGSKLVDVLLPKASTGLHWVGEVAPAGGTLSEAARGLGTAIDNGLSIRATFEKIAASDDPYGEALVTATCYGLRKIAEQAQQTDQLRPATAQSWEDFLNSELVVLLPLKTREQISGRVAQFNNAAALASIDPRAAYVYVRECAIRS